MKLPRRLTDLGRWLDRRKSKSVLRIKGYDRYLAANHPKRALLSYLPGPVKDQMAGGSSLHFSNYGIAVTFPKVLNKLGYIVDVINWDDTSFEPEDLYDLVIFHGGHNFTQLKPRLLGYPVIIYFSTGTYWKNHNGCEKKRFKDFRRRHGTELPPDRFIDSSEEAPVRAANGIISLGDLRVAATYPLCTKVLPLNNASYVEGSIPTGKIFATARDNFLFFAGNGNVHKGLDILIDAFLGLTAKHLYVATNLERRFLDVYRPKLADSANIHLLGRLKLGSAKFMALVDTCAFVVLASCSEGSPGSVVDAMHHGLIPVLSR